MSPSRRLECSRRTRSRRSSSSSASSTACSSETAATTFLQKLRPTTDAEKSTDRRWGGSTSRRDAIAAVTVTGRPVPEAPSASAAESSSTKSGFPSETATSRSTISSLPDGSSTRPCASSRVSAALSGSRTMLECAGSRAPHGRSSRSSGRVRTTITTAAWRSCAARYSIRSSSDGAAQWMSSKTTSVGCSLPRHSIMRRIARNTSRWFTPGMPVPSPRSNPM